MTTLGDLGMAHDPALRGNHAVYRENEVNHCPGCGRTQWIIGRVMAECAFCSTAIGLTAKFAENNQKPFIFRRDNSSKIR